MKLLLAISTMGLVGCVSQIFLDGPVESSASPEVRIVHVRPVPTQCPQAGMGACYLATDGEDGRERLLEAPPGRLDYVPGSDYVVEVTEQPGKAGTASLHWVVNRVVDHHPRAR